MLLVTPGVAILFDAPPDLHASELPKALSAIFLTDRDSPFVRSARRLAQLTGVRLELEGHLTRPVRIEPYRVIHTRTHPTYAYRIVARRIVVYAPEFFRTPRTLLHGADIAILDGSTWGRDIIFANRTGGHRDAADAVRIARDLGVREIYLSHIGRRTEANGPEALKLRDGRVLTV